MERGKKEIKKMKVRKANQKDVNEVIKLGKKIEELEFSSKFPFHDKSELKEALKDKNSVFLIAEENKKIIGFLLAKILFHRTGGWCMLDNLAVKKDERCQGVGTELLKQLYSKLKKEKINYVQVLEEEHHNKTREFWKDKGFKETKKFIWAEMMLK